MQDQYFTPVELADAAVKSVRLRKVCLVGDFAAGHGDLLKAVRGRWQDCVTVGCDVDKNCLDRLKADNAVSFAVRCDFLNASSREKSSQLRRLKEKFDLVILNPPFSGKGGATVSVRNGDALVSCSKAMAFVYTSLSYLRAGGELVAVLPASCLSSEKDRKIRELCSCVSTQDTIQSFSPHAFRGCVASTVVVRFRKQAVGRQTFSNSRTTRKIRKQFDIHVQLVRGCTPVFKAENGLAGSTFPFVHSTDIRGSEVFEYERAVKSTTRTVWGPAVLLTRVGSPVSKKCAVYNCEQPIAISDCVIALQCASLAEARTVRNRIVENWSLLAIKYGGTCAPYITLENLKAFLVSIQVGVE